MAKSSKRPNLSYGKQLLFLAVLYTVMGMPID